MRHSATYSKARTLAVLAALVVAGLLSSQTIAADTKSDLCHLGADGIYKLLTLEPNALANHLARHLDGLPLGPVPQTTGYQFGADCSIESIPEVIFAVAYTDMVDDGGGYDPDTDVLIAKLVDNGDGVLGPGDTVITNAYPTKFDPPFDSASDFGRFTKTSHVVQSVGFAVASPAEIQVITNDALIEFFAEGSDLSGGATVWHRYYEEALTIVTGSEFSWIDDFPNFDTPFGPWNPYLNLWTNPSSPSEPESTVEMYEPAGYDDRAFIDVEISLP